MSGITKKHIAIISSVIFSLSIILPGIIGLVRFPESFERIIGLFPSIGFFIYFSLIILALVFLANGALMLQKTQTPNRVINFANRGLVLLGIALIGGIIFSLLNSDIIYGLIILSGIPAFFGVICQIVSFISHIMWLRKHE